MSATATAVKSSASQFASVTMSLVVAYKLAKIERGGKQARALDRVKCDACTLIAASINDASLASASVTIVGVTVTRGEEVIAPITVPALAVCKAIAFGGALQGSSKVHAPKG